MKGVRAPKTPKATLTSLTIVTQKNYFSLSFLCFHHYQMKNASTSLTVSSNLDRHAKKKSSLKTKTRIIISMQNPTEFIPSFVLPTHSIELKHTVLH